MARGGRVVAYPKEFKQTAIELALAGDKSVAQVARELEMSVKTLHTWLRAHRQKNNQPTSSKNEDDTQAELRKLRKEVAKLKQERDILKKATAYFAREAL